MTSPITTTAGDRVQITAGLCAGHYGKVVHVRPFLGEYLVRLDGFYDELNRFTNDTVRVPYQWVEKLDVPESAQSRSAAEAVSSRLPGSSPHLTGGSGKAAEHPEQGQPATMEPAETQTAFRTTRRLGVWIEGASEGRAYETLCDITTDDPAVDLERELESGLEMADRIARTEIAVRLQAEVNEPSLPTSGTRQ